MALVPTKNTPTPDFEEEGDLSGGEDTGATAGAEPETKAQDANARVAAAAAKKAKAGTAEPEAAAATAQTAASTSTAVTAPAQAAGSLAMRMAMADPFKSMENALHVDYNTLTRIQVTNGNIKDKDAGTLMGDHAVMELISIQGHWVMSPGGDSKDEESLEFLKYSDDGKTVRDTGEPLEKYLEAAIKAGYDKARIVERLILVGMLESSANGKGPIGELVQIDLAPRSMANFKRHRVSTTFRIGRDLQPAVGAERVKILAEVQNKNGNDWTDANFAAAT